MDRLLTPADEVAALTEYRKCKDGSVTKEVFKLQAQDAKSARLVAAEIVQIVKDYVTLDTYDFATKYPDFVNEFEPGRDHPLVGYLKQKYGGKDGK